MRRFKTAALRPARFVGIHTKILVMLLTTSLLSAITVGAIGYFNGSSSLEAAVSNKLVQIRETRAQTIERYFKELQDNSVIFTRGETMRQALKAYSEGFRELKTATVAPEKTAKLKAYYEGIFVPELKKNLPGDSSFEAETFIPSDPAARYLQATYTANEESAGSWNQLGVADAGDGSKWSQANAQFNDFFKELVERFGYEDASLVDAEGNIVYSAYKGADLGTNVTTGVFAVDELEGAYKEVLRANTADVSQITDYVPFQPSYGRPTSFVVSPIPDNGKNIGALVLHTPSTAIDDIMTTQKQWEATGLEKTGEAYLLGPDHTMRSNSRILLEEPDTYERKVTASGTDPAVAREIVDTKDSVLRQPVRNHAVELAEKGQRGLTRDDNYAGHLSLIAYAPLKIEGLEWSILVEQDIDEALAPVDRFTRNLLVALAALVLAVTFMSMVMARIFVLPVKNMLAGVRRVTAGNYGEGVYVDGNDEFRELSDAFNDMSRSLRAKEEVIQQQERENRKILSEVMPDTMIDRYQKGEEIITEEHPNTTIIYADIDGLDEFAERGAADETLAATNELLRRFDEAASRLGVERVRTLRSGYLASSGLEVPRVDHARRVVDFALEMGSILRDFNRTHDTDVQMKAGIDSGHVMSGLVGQTNLAYDLWGEAVKLAYLAHSEAQGSGVFATEAVRERLQGNYTFSPAGSIDKDGREEQLWRLEGSAARGRK